MDMATSSSQIFCPYRAIGFFSNHVPLVCQSQGSDSVVVTSVGKSFHVYKVSHIILLKILEFCMIMLLISMQCDKLKLIFVGMCAYLVSIAINRYFFLFLGTHQPEPLECLAIQGKIVFASYGNVIKAFKRGREVNVYRGHEGCITNLIPFGEHLVSIDDCICLKIWQIKKSGKVQQFVVIAPFLSISVSHSYTHIHMHIYTHTHIM